MRNTPVLDALINGTRQRLLASTILQPDHPWYLQELARHLQCTPSSLQRDLARFADAGILKIRPDGNRVLYQADRECPIFPELRQILEKTAGLVDVLHDVLAPFAAQIDYAFVYGSVAAQRERSASDVDVMLIGRLRLSDLAAALRAAEGRLRRPVNPTIYTPGEFLRKFREKSHFLTSVLRTRRLFLYGNQSGLEALTRRGTVAAAPDQPRRTGAPPRGRRT